MSLLLLFKGSDGGSTNVDVSVTGISSSASFGSVEITAFASIAASTLLATSALGSITELAAANTIATGLASNSSVGSVIVQSNASYSATGFAAQSSIGEIVIVGAANSQVSGVASSASVGMSDASGDAQIESTGLESSFGLGETTVTTGGAISVDVDVAGFAALALVGGVTVQISDAPTSPPIYGGTSYILTRPIKDALFVVAGMSSPCLVGRVLVDAEQNLSIEELDEESLIAAWLSS